MKLMIDTNIVLDVLLKREPFYKTSYKIFELSDKNNINEYISASSLTDIYYIANRQLHNRKELLEYQIKQLIALLEQEGLI